MTTTNKQRLLMETSGIILSDDEIQIYLSEAGLTDASINYDASDPSVKKKIYQAALAILNSIANDPAAMKNYKLDNDLTISQFAENIQARIDQLERQIRQMPTQRTDSNMFMLFLN